MVNKLNNKAYPIGRALPDSSFALSEKAEKIAEQIGYHPGRSVALVNMGMARFYQNRNNEAVQYLEKAVKISIAVHDSLHIAAGYECLSQVYRQMSEYAKSINSAYEALKIHEARNNRLGKLDSYNNIANVYNDQQNFQKALEYYNKAKSYIQDDEQVNQSNLFNNLGLVYIELGSFDTAMFCFNRSLSLRLKMKNNLKIADVMTNMGVCYSYMGEYDKALGYFQKALPVYEKLNNDLYMEIVFTNMGDCYARLRKFALAKEYLEKGQAIAIKLNDKEGMKESYRIFSNLYAETGDFKKAYDFNIRFTEFRDSLISQQSQSQIAEIQTHYETEKKQKEIEWLNKEKNLKDEIIQKQNLQKVFFIGGIAILIAFSVYIFISLRRKQRDNIIIRNQKAESDAQKKTIEEKNKEIVDSIHYAQRIQKAMLSNEKYLEKNIGRLKGDSKQHKPDNS